LFTRIAAPPSGRSAPRARASR